MRILIDTHILLWALLQPERLPRGAASALGDPGNAILFSAASIWEIAIKAQLKRTAFSVSPAEIAHSAREAGFAELVVESDTAARVAALPLHHADPFDRLLVAQALAYPARFLTADRALAPYSELVTVV